MYKFDGYIVKSGCFKPACFSPKLLCRRCTNGKASGMVAAVVGAGYDVLSFDLFGHGFSDVPEATYSYVTAKMIVLNCAACDDVFCFG
jgi:pimeloyl-ACP methyl ester carboxylesterase